MLYDSLPQRMKYDPDFMKLLNEGFIGDVKSQNIPGVQKLIDFSKKQRDSI